tara:strand:- start:895 stop:1158 length:264 start_codon:yes stop_codon:yes gene_type:complete
MPKDTDSFPDGLILKHPHPNAPEFIRAKMSIVRKDLIKWLESRDEDWINCDIKLSKSGSLYAQVDDWKPSKASATPRAEGSDDGLPF